MDKKIDPKRTWPKGYEPKEGEDEDITLRLGLMSNILNKKTEKKLNTDIFKVMATRRSTRKFSTNPVERWKIDKILAAADSAPTAGNFQGFEIFYISDKDTKEELVKAANKQPYVNTPLVLVFCMNPARVKLDFSPKVIMKFSIKTPHLQQHIPTRLLSTGLTIWIGMFDEEKVKEIIGTDLRLHHYYV